MVCIVLAALEAGCGSATTSQRSSSAVLGRCGMGPMTPVGIEELISKFRANQVSLREEHTCTAPSYLAEAANEHGSVGARQQEITARQGDVYCMILPASHGVRVRLVRYPGDPMTWVSTLNVLCAVFPSDDAHAASQIEAVERSVRALVRLHPKR
jgi:hypothetical protein